MNPWARALLGRDTSRKALGLSAVEGKGTQASGWRETLHLLLLAS